MRPDIVIFSLFRTDNPYSSISLSMAKALAPSVRVLYVNHPYSWKDLIKGIFQGNPALRPRLKNLLLFRAHQETLDTIPHNCWVITPPPTIPINWLPPGKVYDYFQRLNNRIVLGCIARATQALEFHNYLYINCYNPFFAGWLPPEMGAKLSLYHCIDDISQNAYTARHGIQLEAKACQQADCTLVTSTNLYQLKAPIARRVQTFFNAADVAIFAKARTESYPRPEALNHRPGQVIGFIGNLDELRIDYVLLRQIAQHFPDKTLLLVGPVNSIAPAEIGLTDLPNVVFAGSRPLQDLPPLLQYMDCVLIPFLCNTLTFSIYPLKINEYLAAGKPVVSTRFSADIGTFAPYIYLADDSESFIRQIGSALQENNPASVSERVAVANQNTWEARIEQLFALVNTLSETTIPNHGTKT